MLHRFDHPSLPSLSTARASESAFARDVREGLSQRQKSIPAEYLYDSLGSALFEAITEMPEYGLTRADERLLRDHADEIAARGPFSAVVELGSGGARKTRPILEAILRLQPEIEYTALDVSTAALERCRRELGGMPGAQIHTLSGTYLESLRQATWRRGEGAVLVIFSGSSIGNFDREAADQFLREMREILTGGDMLLLGADLVQNRSRMLAAYNDPAGVSAAFTRNVLARINRELAGNFDLSAFSYHVTWSPEYRRVEMHLRALKDCWIVIPGADYEGWLRAGETIWTESSYKFERDELPAMARKAGFLPRRQWMDRDWLFTENLWMVPSSSAVVPILVSSMDLLARAC